MIGIFRSRLFYLFVVLFIIGLLIPILSRPHRVKFGEHYIYCDPNAKINPDKKYRLRFWDYNWPVLENEGGYYEYLKKLVTDFNRLYPNITIEITLLDLLEGPSKLTAALESNTAPDVYCSGFEECRFNLKRQIPVGFYLSNQERAEFFNNVLKMVQVQEIETSIPRWVVPGLWVGNRKLLQNTGLDVIGVTNGNYRLEDLLQASTKLEKGKIFFMGNLGSNGFFPNLAFNRATDRSGSSLSAPGVSAALEYMDVLLKQNKIPRDCESTMLEKFIKGDLAIMAGVRPLIYRFLCSILSEKSREIVMLPIPSIDREHKLMVENGVISIYRNRWTKGNEHLAAAVKFGKFVATYPKTNPFQELMFIPASRKCALQWKRGLGPVLDGGVEEILELIEQATLYSPPEATSYQSVIYPILKEFCARKISKEEAKIKLLEIKEL